MKIDLSIIPTNELILLVKETVREEISHFETFVQTQQNHFHVSNSKTMTRKQLKEHLQCSYPTIDKMMREGTIPFYRAGKKILFIKDDVLKALSPQSNLINKKFGGKRVN